MNGKELLKKIGEETLYSAKGHFKSVDLRRIQTKWTIVGCMILNIVGIIGISSGIDKWLSAIGILGTFFLFYWDAEDGKDYKAKHKQAGEAYLSLHKQVRECFFLTTCNEEDIRKISKEVRDYEQMHRPDIPWLARKWAQKAIEKYDETDNWFNK